MKAETLNCFRHRDNQTKLHLNDKINPEDTKQNQVCSNQTCWLCIKGTLIVKILPQTEEAQWSCWELNVFIKGFTVSLITAASGGLSIIG